MIEPARTKNVPESAQFSFFPSHRGVNLLKTPSESRFKIKQPTTLSRGANFTQTPSKKPFQDQTNNQHLSPGELIMPWLLQKTVPAFTLYKSGDSYAAIASKSRHSPCCEKQEQDFSTSPAKFTPRPSAILFCYFGNGIKCYQVLFTLNFLVFNHFCLDFIFNLLIGMARNQYHIPFGNAA